MEKLIPSKFKSTLGLDLTTLEDEFLLQRYTILLLETQEEITNKTITLEKEKKMNEEYGNLKKEILKRLKKER